MGIDDLIRVLIGYLRQHHGSFYTSTNLRNNPDVCHAACTWFLHNVQTRGPQGAISFLDSTDKSTFKATQKQVTSGPKLPSQMLSQVRGSGKGISDQDITAIQFAIDHHRQPTNYLSDVTTVVANLVISMMTGQQDGMMIYMLGGSGGGHVICLRRNVGGILIYDPNMGIMSARLAETETWAHVLRSILSWYRDQMGLTRFAYLFK